MICKARWKRVCGRRKNVPDDDDDDRTRELRGFWSGNIAFGLVSVPVSLFSANRAGGVSLRMVDEDGTPLQRRYFCSKEERLLENDEIVRGYEVEEDRFVVVEDDELEAISPDKSREIKLENFVAVTDIDPAYFERAYFLIPDEDGSRPYWLLARVMEETGRAGIATFVMRGKEYLVAILAKHGVLRAETLRFHDELRKPGQIGLPDVAKPDSKLVRSIHSAMRKLQAETLDEGSLIDEYSSRLEGLVERKLRKGEDVVKAPDDVAPGERESAEVIDLMQILKERMRSKGTPTGAARSAQGAKAGRGALERRTKEELYERAKTLGISGRSSMSKQELISAIRDER
jgi:DNA end-binding protein Ku